MTEPGIYLSELEGHLFVYKDDPVRVCCIACLEICDQSTFKNKVEFAVGVKAFVEKHGYMSRTRIALRIEPFDLSFVDPNLVPFPVDPAWVKESLGIDLKK